MDFLKNTKDFLLKAKNLFGRPSIKAKFIKAFLLIAVSLSLVYTATFFAFRQSIAEYEQLIKNADIANRIPSMYMVMLDDFKNYLVASHEEYGKFQKSITEIENLVSYIKANTKISHNASIAQLTGISNQLKLIKSKTAIAIKYRNDGDLEKANSEFYDLTNLSDFLKDNISQYVSKELNYSIASRELIYNKSIILGLASTFLIILIIVLGLLYGIRLSQSTAKAILKIANQELSDEEIQEQYGEEELDRLYTQFAKLQRNLREYISQLSSSEKRLSTILDEMSDCVIIASSNGVIEYINPVVEKTFEYKQEELLQNNINVLIPNIEIRNGVYCAKNDDLNPYSPNLIDGKFQFTAERKNCNQFPIEIGINKTSIDGKDFFIIVLHDITEHKEVEKLKDEFVSIVSHELRTPLTSIKGALEFSLSGVLGAIPEKINELLNIALNNSNRLNNLINDILDINKISQGKIDFTMENLCLLPIIEETINNNISYAKQYDVSICIKNDINNNIYIKTDKNRFIQVLTNLISNAIKFSHKKGQVDIYVEENEKSVLINVQDYGIGIAKKNQEKLFKKFVQVDSSSTRAKGGTGLGLNISKMLIEKMNGKINFVSEENIGTTFSVQVPKL